MLNLIKYEFIKKYRLFAAILITTVLANIFVVIKFGRNSFAGFGPVLAVVLYVLYIVDITRMYSVDLNRKTGYMLFMTPNSGYRIITSKVLTAVVEGIGMLIFYLIVAMANVVPLIEHSDSGTMILNHLEISYGELAGYISIILLVILVSAILFIMTVYASITIRKSLLNNMKFKGLFTFLIFIGLNYITSNIMFKIYETVDYFKSYGGYSKSSMPSVSEFMGAVSPHIITTAVLIILLGLGSGYLLERKINL